MAKRFIDGQEVTSSAFLEAVGTVSESGGVPTGAIIESGSNANGNYIKYADGTMICTKRESITLDINLSNNVLYRSGEVSARSFPATFSSIPVTHISIEGGGDGNISWIVSDATTAPTVSAWGSFQVIDTSSATAVTYFYCFMAIGRWY